MGVTGKYLLLTWKHVSGPGVSAFAPKGLAPDHELVLELAKSSELPFDLTLVKLTPHRNGLDVSADISELTEIWPDYMPNNQAWPLFSANLRQIVDRRLIHDEGLYWISAKVTGAGETPGVLCCSVRRFA